MITAGASQRIGRHSGARSSRTKPATTIGKSSGPIMITSIGRAEEAYLAGILLRQGSAHGPLRPVVRGLPDEVGQREHQRDGDPAEQGPAQQRPSRADQQNAAQGGDHEQADQPLVVGAQPDQRSHRQPPPGSPRRNTRRANSRTSGHTTRSIDVVRSRWPKVKVKVAKAYPQAARPWASRPAPTSRATKADDDHRAGRQQSRGQRSAHNSSTRSVVVRAISGVSGGWSM